MSSTTRTTVKKPVFKKEQIDDRDKFQPLPEPAGAYPYRLKLEEIQTIAGREKMVFHMVGDTGSLREPAFQRLVAGKMAEQYKEPASAGDRPTFLYHLGDVVYNFGEAEHYYEQFFDPYRDYPGPVFAIAGNHDADVNPDRSTPCKSLDAFTRVFCDTESRKNPLAGGTGRLSMVQPNIYWTLQTPLADFIGLYSNVPKYGLITEDQKHWFVSELKAASEKRDDKALIVCLHHAPYSADTNHSSSRPMIEFLETAFEEAGIKPDIVFSGHVHSYQRFSKQYKDGTTVPYIVAGAGGYADRHTLAHPEDSGFSCDSELFDQVRLEKFCDEQHGFLKIAVEKAAEGLSLTVEYYTVPDAALSDRFTFYPER